MVEVSVGTRKTKSIISLPLQVQPHHSTSTTMLPLQLSPQDSIYGERISRLPTNEDRIVFGSSTWSDGMTQMQIAICNQDEKTYLSCRLASFLFKHKFEFQTKIRTESTLLGRNANKRSTDEFELACSVFKFALHWYSWIWSKVWFCI